MDSAARKKVLLSIIVVLIVLVFDQWLKFYIKTNYTLAQEHTVFGLDWFRIHFTENPGMAFGIELPGIAGKVFLTIFRLVASFFIIYYLRIQIKQNAKAALIVLGSLVLAGALGNIIDSIFYGKFFSESSYYKVAQFLGEEPGYGNWFQGKVVDMLYFPLFRYNDFIFFRPVFNLADASITTGIFSIILFQKRLFSQDTNKEEITTETASIDEKPEPLEPEAAENTGDGT